MNFLKNSPRLFLYFLMMSAALAVGSAHAFNISGTIRDSITTNPIDGTVSPFEVRVFEGSPCQEYNWIASTTMTDVNGAYTLTGVPAGNYMITASNLNQSDYFAKVWWSSNGGEVDCQGAQPVDLSSGDAVGIDFSIGTGYSISGTVFETDGTTPLATQVSVTLYQGSACDWRNHITSVAIDTTVGPTQGQYTIRGVPDGIYHLITSNDNSSDYINEWYASGGSSFDCSVSESVSIAAAPVGNIDFQLDIGGSVSGTIRDEASVPITSFQGWVDARIMQNGELNYYNSVGASGGIYTLRGLPFSPAEVFISTGSNDGSYGKEYWASAGSTPYLNSAEPVAVPSSNIDFHLGPGASMHGSVVDPVGTPVANARVSYWNQVAMHNMDVFTDGGGFFNLVGLPPGPAEIRVEPDSATGLATFERDDYYLDPQAVRNIGTIRLVPGTRVYGYIKGPGDVTLPESVEFYFTSHGYGHDYWGRTAADGYFEVFLPPRPSATPYYMGLDDFGMYTMVPQVIVVPDLPGGLDLGIITAYDSGDVYSGAVNGPVISEGALAVVALSNDSNPTTADTGDFRFVAGFDNIAGSYSLFVPTGHMSKLWLVYAQEGLDGQESHTILTEVKDLTGGGVFDLNYTLGATVSGYITNQGEPVFKCLAYLTRTDGSFVAEVETGRDGYYQMKYVPDGTYQVEVLDRNNKAIKGKWFTIAGADLIVPTFDLAQGDELAVDFGSGFGVWHYDAAGWNQLSDVNVEWLGAYGGKLLGDFGSAYGLYEYDGMSWTKLSAVDADNTGNTMVSWGNGIAVDFGSGTGVWNYDGVGWKQVSTVNVEWLGTYGGKLVGDFGSTYGLYEYDGVSWTQLSAADADNTGNTMVYWGNGIVVDFGPGLGVWHYNGAAWKQLSTVDVEWLGAYGDKLVGDFGAAYGLYEYDGLYWTQLSAVDADNTGNTLVVWGNDIVVDFGAGFGVWHYNGAAWKQLSTVDVEWLGVYGGRLVGDFGIAYGLYEYTGTTWTSLSTADAENLGNTMKGVNLY